VLLTGDLILDEPEPDRFFDAVRGVLASADVRIGHVEVPHTARGVPQDFDVPAPAADITHLRALANAGFDIATLAGNHMYDAGRAGIEDTVAGLRGHGIATAGAGMSLSEARMPAIVSRKGVRVGCLSYNCVGPEESWATDDREGCAYVAVQTNGHWLRPGDPPDLAARADPSSLAMMKADISRLRASCDVVVVALHKGIGHTPAVVAPYERDIAHAAVDAGADIVVGHHAHILRGIEVYRDRPIFHGLGNFVTVTRALSLGDNPSPKRLAWAKRRRELFGFEPLADYPTYPFHPDARNTVLAVCRAEGGRIEAGFIPCWVEASGRPVPLSLHNGGDAVGAYVERITREAGLDSGPFRWDPRGMWTVAVAQQEAGL
jgi:poly-gamma-glutamate synthesis protein (capsule biosynthesis protein)